MNQAAWENYVEYCFFSLSLFLSISVSLSLSLSIYIYIYILVFQNAFIVNHETNILSLYVVYDGWASFQEVRRWGCSKMFKAGQDAFSGGFAKGPGPGPRLGWVPMGLCPLAHPPWPKGLAPWRWNCGVAWGWGIWVDGLGCRVGGWWICSIWGVVTHLGTKEVPERCWRTFGPKAQQLQNLVAQISKKRRVLRTPPSFSLKWGAPSQEDEV